MTCIRFNNRYTAIDLLVIGLITLSLTGVISLIILYNQTVDMHHEISQMKERIQESEAEGAELKETILGLFNSHAIQEVAKERGLIQNRSPHYVEVAQWVAASQ